MRVRLEPADVVREKANCELSLIYCIRTPIILCQVARVKTAQDQATIKLGIDTLIERIQSDSIQSQDGI